MFTEAQLDSIKQAASKTKNQGEMAVFDKLLEQQKAKATHWPYVAIFSEEQFKIIEYCAEECKRQFSGEMSVYDMVNAWDFAAESNFFYPDGDKSNKIHAPITNLFIEYIGRLVEPVDNKKGFRTIPIGVTDVDAAGKPIWIEKAQYAEIPRLLEHLLTSYYEGFLSPDYYTPVPDTDMRYSRQQPLAKSAEDQFYYDFENIHPFRDGNGRTGKILYNYLKGTLDNPQMPPNFWGGSNP